MPRRPLFRTDQIAYHVTARSNNKEWFYLPIDDVWEVFADVFCRCYDQFRFELHAFVMMSNHYHFIVSTPDRNLDRIMRYTMTETARKIAKKADRINHIFGGRYRWSTLSSATSLSYVFKYVHRNPIRAGLASKVEDYRYNASFFPDASRNFPLSEGFTEYWKLIPRDPKDRLEWLNQPTRKESEELIARGLRRYDFQFSHHNGDQKLLRDLYASYGVAEETPATFWARK